MSCVTLVYQLCKEVFYVDSALLSRVCEYVYVCTAAVRLDVAISQVAGFMITCGQMLS